MTYYYNGKEFMSSLDKNIQSYKHKANSKESLNHYTDIESFFRIIKNKNLKLNAIDNLNDKMESEYLEEEELNRLVFISSFCHGLENIPLWHMYTSKNYGLNIEFEYKSCKKGFIDVIYDNSRPIEAIQRSPKNEIDKYFINGDVEDQKFKWLIDLRITDVCYDSEIRENNPVYYVGDFKYDLNAMGLFKNEFWKYEEETRLIGKFRTTETKTTLPTYDYILIPVTFENVLMTVKFSPWMSEEIKECVKVYAKQYLGDDKAKFIDSRFTDQLIRKY